MPNIAIKLISTIFVIIWSLIIISEFWQYDPTYSKSLKLFQYYDLLAFFLSIGTGLIWLKKKRGPGLFKYFNGLSILGGMLLINIISIWTFYSKLDGLNLKIAGLFPQVGQFLGVALCVFFIYLVIRLFGVLCTTIFPINIIVKDLPLIQIALGITIFTSILFFLGFLGVLSVFILLPICLIPLTLYWRLSVQIIRETLFTTIPIPKTLMLQEYSVFCF